MKALPIVAALAGALLISSKPVQAGPFMAQLGDTVKVTSDRLSSNETATISFVGLPGGATSLSVYSGPEMLSGTFGTAGTAFKDLLFYCTDLYNYSSGTATYTVGHLTSSHQPSGLNDLTTAQINNIAMLISLNHSDQSATQLSIWKVEYGAAFSFKDTSGSVAADVTAYMASLDGGMPANVQLYQMHDTGVQGFAYIAPVPEPAALGVLGAGLLGLCFVNGWRIALAAQRSMAAVCCRRGTF